MMTAEQILLDRVSYERDRMRRAMAGAHRMDKSDNPLAGRVRRAYLREIADRARRIRSIYATIKAAK